MYTKKYPDWFKFLFTQWESEHIISAPADFLVFTAIFPFIASV